MLKSDNNIKSMKYACTFAFFFSEILPFTAQNIVKKKFNFVDVCASLIQSLDSKICKIVKFL